MLQANFVLANFHERLEKLVEEDEQWIFNILESEYQDEFQIARYVDLPTVAIINIGLKDKLFQPFITIDILRNTISIENEFNDKLFYCLNKYKHLFKENNIEENQQTLENAFNFLALFFDLQKI